MDEMFTKTHRDDPFVVLTAPFGGSTSPTAPFSARTGVVAPGNRYATNTWRNNFAIQKGVGCPAEAQIISDLLHNPNVRLACPHMRISPDESYVCSIASTEYRGEEHSIWLRMMKDGYQVVDLNLPTVYSQYLRPSDTGVPVFALIAMLYSMSPPGLYPARERVGIPDFAEDFDFDLGLVETTFDCDPESEYNSGVLRLVDLGAPGHTPGDGTPGQARHAAAARRRQQSGVPLPVETDPVELNTGIGAERAVAEQLVELGWHVLYRGNQPGTGYDLEALKEGQTLRVEVKSSVGFTTPQLTESEWTAAQFFADEFVLGVVDFYGSQNQSIWYVRNPAAVATATEILVARVRLKRSDLRAVGTDVEFL